MIEEKFTQLHGRSYPIIERRVYFNRNTTNVYESHQILEQKVPVIINGSVVEHLSSSGLPCTSSMKKTKRTLWSILEKNQVHQFAPSHLLWTFWEVQLEESFQTDLLSITIRWWRRETLWNNDGIVLQWSAFLRKLVFFDECHFEMHGAVNYTSFIFETVSSHTKSFECPWKHYHWLFGWQ